MRSKIVVAALLLLSASSAQAQRPGRGEQSPLIPSATIEKLQLNADQKEKFAKVEQTYKDHQKASEEKLKTAAQNKDRAAYRQISDDNEATRKDLIAKVESFLTETQKKTLTEVKPDAAARRAGAGQPLPAQLFERLNLTDEQKKKMEDLKKDYDAKVQNLLTDEQKKKLEELKTSRTRRPATSSRRPELRAVARRT